VLNALNVYKVWDAIDLHGEASYASIAAKVNLPEELVHRLLRHAMSRHIFTTTTPDGDTVKHTSLSAAFITDPKLRSWISHHLEEVQPSAANLPQTLKHYANNITEPDKTATAYTFYRDRPEVKHWFDFYAQPGEEVRAPRFAEAMNYLMSNPSLALEHVHRMYDWNALGKVTLVDVGGSVGHVSCELARAYPEMTFVVQDLPELVEPFAKTCPAELKSRVSFVAHDFFEEQPVKGADVYFLKHILHDWSDPWAAKIIRALIPAMNKGAKIILLEGIVPPAGKAPPPVSRLMSALDMQMLVALNSKERTVEQWQGLFKLADERLVFKGVHQPPGVGFAVIEAEFTG
jgi:hypothetical protein